MTRPGPPPFNAPWPPGRWLWLAGAILGGGQAALGLLLSAGGVRYALAFAGLAALALVATRRISAPTLMPIMEWAARVGWTVAAIAAGLAAGFLAFGVPGLLPVTNWPLDPLFLAGAALAGAAVGRWGRQRRALRLALAAGAGLMAGAGLGQGVPWVAARYAVWGIAGGGLLGAALAGLWLKRNTAESEAASGRAETALVFAASFVLLFNGALPRAWDDTGVFNLYPYQAASFLRGRLDLFPPIPLDVVQFGGHDYSPFPPFPALVLMPIVWAQGASEAPAVPMSVIGAGLAAAAGAALNDGLRRLGLNAGLRHWTTAALVFGTGLWMCVLDVDSSHTYFAQIVSVLGLVLAGREVLGSGPRGWLAGLWLGCSFLSRQTTLLAGVFVAGAIWLASHRSGRERWLNLAGFAAGLGVCVAAYLAFNALRFGDPLDTGYSHILFTGYQKDRLQEFGTFSWAYLPSNFYYLFLHGFHIEFAAGTRLEVVGMDPFGTSLTIASPFLLLALFSRWQSGLKPLAWASILLMIGLQLLYITNGWVQINTQRYALDYIPLLMLLVGLAARHTRPAVFKDLIVYSIGLNLLALFFVPGLR